MPNKDGTGPDGQGPRAGRGAGNRNGQRGAGGLGRGAGSNNTQGKPWIQSQFNNLQAAIQKLTEQLDGTKKEK